MNKIKSITIIGLFTAITIVLANTIGFIPLGPLAITTMHIPVLVCALAYGKEFGAVMGLIFGLTSLFRAYTQPTATSFIMMNPLVSVLPRLAFGFLTGLIYQGLKNRQGKVLARKNFDLALAAGAGTALHSILVLSAAYLVFKSAYIVALGKAVNVIIIGSLLNMVLEVALAALVVPPIVNALKRGAK